MHQVHNEWYCQLSASPPPIRFQCSQSSSVCLGGHEARFEALLSVDKLKGESAGASRVPVPPPSSRPRFRQVYDEVVTETSDEEASVHSDPQCRSCQPGPPAESPFLGFHCQENSCLLTPRGMEQAARSFHQTRHGMEKWEPTGWDPLNAGREPAVGGREGEQGMRTTCFSLVQPPLRLLTEEEVVGSNWDGESHPTKEPFRGVPASSTKRGIEKAFVNSAHSCTNLHFPERRESSHVDGMLCPEGQWVPCKAVSSSLCEFEPGGRSQETSGGTGHGLSLSALAGGSAETEEGSTEAQQVALKASAATGEQAGESEDRPGRKRDREATVRRREDKTKERDGQASDGDGGETESEDGNRTRDGQAADVPKKSSDSEPGGQERRETRRTRTSQRPEVSGGTRCEGNQGEKRARMEGEQNTDKDTQYVCADPTEASEQVDTDFVADQPPTSTTAMQSKTRYRVRESGVYPSGGRCGENRLHDVGQKCRSFPRKKSDRADASVVPLAAPGRGRPGPLRTGSGLEGKEVAGLLPSPRPSSACFPGRRAVEGQSLTSSRPLPPCPFMSCTCVGYRTPQTMTEGRRPSPAELRWLRLLSHFVAGARAARGVPVVSWEQLFFPGVSARCDLPVGSPPLHGGRGDCVTVFEGNSAVAGLGACSRRCPAVAEGQGEGGRCLANLKLVRTAADKVGAESEADTRCCSSAEEGKRGFYPCERAAHMTSELISPLAGANLRSPACAWEDSHTRVARQQRRRTFVDMERDFHEEAEDSLSWAACRQGGGCCDEGWVKPLRRTWGEGTPRRFARISLSRVRLALREELLAGEGVSGDEHVRSVFAEKVGCRPSECRFSS